MSVERSVSVQAEKVFVNAHAPALRYGGRWDFSYPGAALTGRGATYISARFTGPYVAAELRGADVRWRVSVDGGAWRRFYPLSGATVLATNLGEGTHTLFLGRDIEGTEGISEFRGLVLAAGHGLVEPPAAPEKLIEFVGDSITAGAFVEGTYADYYEVENGFGAFGVLAAQALGADWSCVAASGEGVARNYAEYVPGTDGTHAQTNYERTFYSALEPKWPGAYRTQAPVAAGMAPPNSPGGIPRGESPQERHPQLVVLNHGANDYLMAPFLPAETFQRAYRELVQAVRHMHPQAVIVCLEPIPKAEGARVAPHIAAVVKALRAAGDKQVVFIGTTELHQLLTPGDFAGDYVHPLATGHRKIADWLAPRLRSVMGW